MHRNKRGQKGFLKLYNASVLPPYLEINIVRIEILACVYIEIRCTSNLVV